MITDLQLALACQFTYSGTQQTWGDDVTHVYLCLTENSCIIAFEGTTDIAEWGVDFEAVPVDARTYDHQDLGLVHLGWWNDVASVSEQIIAYLKTQPARIELGCTGHSKGAGEALIFAADAKLHGIQWSRVSTFGTPHCGALEGLITSDLGCDYRNWDDPICHVPFYLPRPREMTNVKSQEPQFNTPDWLLLWPHHIQNYIAAIRALSSASA